MGRLEGKLKVHSHGTLILNNPHSVNQATYVNMLNSVEGFNAAGWNKLATEASQATHIQAAGTDLPAIPPGSAAWAAFKKSPENRSAYTTQLNAAVKNIQQFLGQHAKTGAQRQQALGKLNDFLHTRVNCHADKLSPLVINESRRNLNLFAQQLNNAYIPADKKLSCALTLAQGLGVCSEGETLNILESTQTLCSLQTGLSGVLNRAKNTLVEQHLQQLVKHEDKPRLNSTLARELEIHHVQALKNHVASQWGLGVVEDRYATERYQTQAGDMAAALLRQTITPAVLANTVAEQIAQSFGRLTDNGLTEGMPTEQLITEPLRQAIEAEFGQGIELEHCLQFNEDYTTVCLKPQQEIALHVLNNCQKIGLIQPHADLQGLLNQPTVDLQQCIEQVSSLRGAVEQRPATSYFLPNFWNGCTKLLSPESKRKEEQNQSNALLATLRRLNIRA